MVEPNQCRSILVVALLLLVLGLDSSVEGQEGPPSVTPDYSDIDATLQKRKAEEATRERQRAELEQKWENYTKKMQNAFSIVKRLDDSPLVSKTEKRKTWERFLSDFSFNSPFGTQDDRMRDHGQMRIRVLRASASKRFEDQKNGTVLDMQVGAYWTLRDSGRRMDQVDAGRYCRYQSLPNCERWRLPTIEELRTLHDPNSGRQGPLTIALPFQLTDDWIWTSSKAPNYDYYSAFVFDHPGGSSSADQNTADASVLCICVPYEGK